MLAPPVGAAVVAHPRYGVGLLELGTPKADGRRFDLVAPQGIVQHEFAVRRRTRAPDLTIGQSE